MTKCYIQKHITTGYMCFSPHNLYNLFTKSKKGYEAGRARTH